MRSRWRGSMFAWILNTKPVNGVFRGLHLRVRASSRGCGGGAQSTSACRISCTPKLLIAEPKNTGVWRPARNASSSNGALRAAHQLDVVGATPRISSGNSRRAADCRGPSIARLSRRAAPRPARSAAAGLRADGRRRGSSRPMPIGQVTGAQSIVEHRSISSSSSSGSRTSRSILLTKVMIGVVAQPAHLEQLDRLRLDALRGVDDHHRGSPPPSARGRCPRRSPRGPACRAG